jgi:hypothetical protein
MIPVTFRSADGKPRIPIRAFKTFIGQSSVKVADRQRHLRVHSGLQTTSMASENRSEPIILVVIRFCVLVQKKHATVVQKCTFSLQN